MRTTVRSELHPVIRELMASLPPVGEAWPMPDRLRWFRALVAALDWIYGKPGEGSISVGIAAKEPIENENVP